jgi:predicted alpha/beta superfamily hydrolase
MKSFHTCISIFLIFLGCGTATSQHLIIDSLAYKESFKKIRLLIPDSSTTETLQSRRVLLMLDAQNLFDAATSYSGEWQVDESVKALPYQSQPIVIGIDHGNAERLNELTPYTHLKYGGGDADFFLNWLEKELIPYLQTAYDIKILANTTAIAGSSLGGLFSHYAILKRPNLFSYAGVLSPSYWYSEKIYSDTERYLNDQPRHFYLSGGTNEDETLIANLKKMETLLNRNNSASVTLKIIKDGEHNEAQWRSSFPLFLKWWINQPKE